MDIKLVRSIADSIMRRGAPATVYGRVMLVRSLSKKLTFITLQDRDAQIQIGIRGAGEIPSRWDVISVTGELKPSNTGELTVWAPPEAVTVLARCGMNPPDNFHGVVDKNIVYKQRYLDLLVNEESRKVFVRRSEIIARIRQFLHDMNFIEIETPVLGATPSGATAKPFVTTHEALHQQMYLRIATEVALKKAIVGGMERVFEIGRIFRNEAVDRTHYPEFTSIELYAAYSDLRGMKILFRDMLNHIGFPSWMYTPGADLPEMEYSDAVATYGQDFETKMPAKMTLVTGQPLEETPLCKAREDDPTKADRFEAFCNGFEVANAYNELNDPDEQAKRLAGANDDGLVEAMRYGMPPCGGMGIGIDRLVMLATGAESIRDVIMFPTSRE